MAVTNFKNYLCVSALLMGSTANAETLWVHCGSTNRLNSIGAALRVLQNSERSYGSTIEVSGACHENVLIKDIDRLTLNAVDGASINDASNGVLETIGIYRSTGITINGLTVNGGEDGIGVVHATVALNGVTAQGAVDDGVGVYAGGDVFIHGGTLQDNGFSGLLVGAGGSANPAGVTIQRNWNGIVATRAGRVNVRVSDPYYDGGSASIPVFIDYNRNFGILAHHDSEIACIGCEIASNAADGVHLDLGATGIFDRYVLVSGMKSAPLSISNNGGVGISVGDLSSAILPEDPNDGYLQGNGGQYQIACNTATSVTRRALQFAAGATNCSN